MKITIVHYGMGNIKSVYNALRFMGADPLVVTTPSEMEGEKIIIPGVGAFGDGIRNLRPFIPKIKEEVASGAFLLGICLGMQMLFDGSEEAPTEKGLGIMKGTVEKIGTMKRLPHIGWNILEVRKPHCPLFKGLHKGYVYFVHSYQVVPKDDIIAAITSYDGDICAGVWKDSVYGTQFHPEKSGVIGLRILKNFLEL